MRRGDIVIAEHPDSKASRLIRSYGIVQEVRDNGTVLIELSDGSLIERRLHSIAVYVKPPANWRSLYRQRQAVYSRSKLPLPSRSAPAKAPHH